MTNPDACLSAKLPAITKQKKSEEKKRETNFNIFPILPLCQNDQTVLGLLEMRLLDDHPP